MNASTNASTHAADRAAVRDRHARILVLLQDAAALALHHFRQLDALQIERKRNGQDLVSAADREVEALLRAGLQEAFPDDGFLGEEFGHAPGASGYTWVIDPVDGTSCFVHGLRSWCIAVALMREGEVLLGVIQDVCGGERFDAMTGQGARLNGRPIAVECNRALDEGLTGFGANLRVPPAQVSGFVHALLRAGGMPYRNGSAALMLAYVACGRLLAYHEPHIHAWDCLAGLLIVREAGGWIAAFPMGDGLLAGAPVTAAAPQVRDALLALVPSAPVTGVATT